jgi:hypothetical protein
VPTASKTETNPWGSVDKIIKREVGISVPIEAKTVKELAVRWGKTRGQTEKTADRLFNSGVLRREKVLRGGSWRLVYWPVNTSVASE